MEKSTFEALGGSYIRVGDYLFPYLIITDSTPLGKWGQLRKQYLKEHRHALYSSMLLQYASHWQAGSSPGGNRPRLPRADGPDRCTAS